MAANLLFVVANAGTPATGEQDVEALLEAQGHTVTYVGEGDAEADTSSYDLVIIFPTVTAATLGTKYKNPSTAGVLAFHFEVAANQGWVGASTTNNNNQAWVILDDTHPLAAGYTGTTPNLWTASINMVCSTLSGGDAVQVARPSTSSTRRMLYGWDDGDQLQDSTLCGKRHTAFAATNASLANLTSDGEAFVLAAVDWTANVTASSDITGAASVSLPALTLSAAGTVDVKGAASLTLPALTLSAAGAIGVTGDAALTLPALTLSSAGAAQVQATASLTLPALALAAAGAVRVQGAAALALPALTLEASGGAAALVGDAAVALPALTLSASGAVRVTGAASLTLPALTLSSTAGVQVQGSASLALPALTLSAAGAARVTAAAALQLPSLMLTSAGAVLVVGSASLTLPMLTVVASSEGPPSVTGRTSVSAASNRTTVTAGSLRTRVTASTS